jgi:hypothetical protein
MHSASANADGSWLTVEIWGDSTGAGWDSSLSQRVIDDWLAQSGVLAAQVDIEPYASFVRIRSPKGSGTPVWQLQIGGEPPTAVWQSRTDSDPIDSAWILEQLEVGLSYLLGRVVREVIAANSRRLMLLALSNWPDGGIGGAAMANAQQPSGTRWTKGSRVATAPLAIGTRDDLSRALMDFLSRAFQDGGFVNFETDIQGRVEALTERLWPSDTPGPSHPRSRVWSRRTRN